jgi:nondiscriminating glutamyl-tRNA synthetase
LNSAVRVRFAPSPTGHLHVGGVRTALFNWLFARHHGGTFILRIEDTDRERSKPEYTDQILESMHWLGLEPDEGPYLQSQRGELHRATLERMLREGTAFRCFIPQEQAREAVDRAKRTGGPTAFFSPDRDLAASEARRRAEAGESHVVRFRCPPEEVVFEDRIRGVIRIDHTAVGDIVLARPDGSPTYNFVVVVDDADMAVTHVIRGEDHISNTPKQILLFRALGHQAPIYAHLPLILAPDKAKLSKRHGAVTAEEFRAAGFLPEALVNYMALLGWSPGNDQEVFTRQELVEQFSLDRIGKSGAVFDAEKLRWLNGVHLRALSDDAFVQWALMAPEMKARAQGQDSESLRRIVLLEKERSRTWEELGDHLGPFFSEALDFDPRAEAKHLGKPTARPLLLAAADLLESRGNFADPVALEVQLRALAEEKAVKFGLLVHPCRVALTGRDQGAGLTQIMAALGRERTVRRLREAASRPITAGAQAAP